MADFIAVFKSRYPKAFALHEENKNWLNVLDHCLIEAARSDVFAKLLGFDQKLRDDMVTASLVHDAYKRKEIEAIKADVAAGGSGLGGYRRAEAEEVAQLEQAGFNERVIRYVGLVGGDATSVFEVKRLLEQPDLSDEDLGALIVHYIDDYTRDALPVEPAAQENGIWINDLDRRARANAAKSQYHGIDEELRKQYAHDPFFANKTAFEAMVAVSRQIEKLVAARVGLLESWQLPAHVEAKIDK